MAVMKIWKIEITLGIWKVEKKNEIVGKSGAFFQDCMKNC